MMHDVQRGQQLIKDSSNVCKEIIISLHEVNAYRWHSYKAFLLNKKKTSLTF